ncbi:hypothetical protein [Microbulbifer sp. SSSA005]|uniref:hypothetical protein n=1 Tax=Microbulbifer sp. SSSA005 TaxID=3243378 RepID=UPI00403A4155
MKAHIPYEERSGRKPDFVVRYMIDLSEENKNAKPGQGMRVDFLYNGDDPQVEGIHMIWPEILDEDGRVIRDTTPGNIPNEGFANMWILSEDRREYHHKRLKIGTKGTWWRGGRIANVTVVQINAVK